MQRKLDEEIDDVADEENERNVTAPRLYCKCLLNERSSEQITVSKRKKSILSTVTRTEAYLRERRIPELIRFLLTKIIAQSSSHPVTYLESLLDDCMLFRAGLGVAPVIYEERHLQAVIKSFDPGNRGWLSAGQVRRAFATLGLTLHNDINDKVTCEEILNIFKKSQENELLQLLSAGVANGANIAVDPENNSLAK